jgi:hypothetical protein
MTNASPTVAPTIEEMASMVLGISEADEAALRRAASVELAAFQAYVSGYTRRDAAEALFGCKGCHTNS